MSNEDYDKYYENSKIDEDEVEVDFDNMEEVTPEEKAMYLAIKIDSQEERR